MGRWDAARVTMAAVDWRQPEAAEIPLLRGELGEVRLEQSEFKAELRGATDVPGDWVAEAIEIERFVVTITLRPVIGLGANAGRSVRPSKDGRSPGRPAAILALDDLTVTAHGVGDGPIPTPVSQIANGESMRPLSPAQLKAWRQADGSLSASWVRRSRLAWGWTDEIEAPVDATVQGFRFKATGIAAAIERDVAGPAVTLTPSDLAMLGAGPISVEVRQIGSLALSWPSTVTIDN